MAGTQATLGDVAVQPGPAAVPAGVLVPGGMVGRPARGTTFLGAESAEGWEECVALLWFLGVYLVVLAFVPA